MQLDVQEGVGYGPSEDLAGILETVTGNESTTTNNRTKTKKRVPNMTKATKARKTISKKAPKSKAPKVPNFCPHCRTYGHMNANSGKCWFNCHNVQARQEAATAAVAVAAAAPAQETANLPHPENANKE